MPVSQVNQLQWRKEDQEDRQEVRISQKKLTQCPGHPPQSFHPPSLLSRKLGDAKKEAKINRKKFHLPAIHPSRNLVGEAEAEGAAEDVEVVVEV